MDEITVSLLELENGWVLHVFNAKSGTKDTPDIFCKTLDEALKLIPDRVAKVREAKE